MSRQRGLGRGLSELIRPAAASGEAVVDLPVAQIDPNPLQPRQDFDPEELAELAASIASQGLLQPITVRPVEGGRYQLVAGERRLRATRDLGRTHIRAIVRDVNDKQLLELALVENMLRADLSDIDVAEGLAQLQQRHGYSAAQLAQVLGKSRSAIANTLRLLELPEPVRRMVRAGELSAGHGRALLSFPESQRVALAQRAAEERLSVRALEQLAQAQPRRKVSAKKTPSPAAASQQYVRRAEQQLIEHLGTKVTIREQAGNGAISISYHGADDLERLLELLLSDSNPF